MLVNKTKGFRYSENLQGYAIKVPVFSFNKFPHVDKNLGPEMKSTGRQSSLSKTSQILSSANSIETGTYTSGKRKIKRRQKQIAPYYMYDMLLRQGSVNLILDFPVPEFVQQVSFTIRVSSVG